MRSAPSMPPGLAVSLCIFNPPNSLHFHAAADTDRVLGSTIENHLAAEARIRDADIAQEAADLVRDQLLQQTGAAILAQANQQPALALKLLQ